MTVIVGRGPNTCQRCNLLSDGSGTREGLFDKYEAEKENTTKSRTTVELLFHLNNTWVSRKGVVLDLSCRGTGSAYFVAMVANEDGLCKRGNSNTILPVSSR